MTPSRPLSANAEARPTLTTHAHAPAPFKELVWDVFFASRGRGVSLQAHFPWLADAGWFVTAEVGGKVVAGLAMRPVASPSQHFRGALIGLVCVDPAHRGQGHSTAVLQAAVQHAIDIGADDVLLWTGAPGVYAKLGFATCDPGAFGWVSTGAAPIGSQAGIAVDAWPTSASGRGLPPFATAGHQWRSARASAIVVTDATGPIVAEWTGADADVIDLLDAALPRRWRINVLQADTLPASLAARGWAVDLAPSALQMMLNLRPRAIQGDPYALRILDRV